MNDSDRSDCRGEVSPQESTRTLLRRVKGGDDEALDVLYGRYLSPLQRFARYRLPDGARDLLETNDIVQEAVLGSLRNLDRFKPERTGSFHAYLRSGVLNRIRDEFRRLGRQPHFERTFGHQANPGPSPVQRAMGAQALERYEAALEELEPIEREAVIARVELGLSYRELAKAIGKPSPDAARMTVVRALVQLAERMAEHAT